MLTGYKQASSPRKDNIEKGSIGFLTKAADHHQLIGGLPPNFLSTSSYAAEKGRAGLKCVASREQRDTVCKLAGAAIRGGWRGGRRLINGTDYNRQARGRGVVLVGLAGRGFGREKKRIAWPFCWGKVPTVSLPVTYPNFSRLFELAQPLHSYIC